MLHDFVWFFFSELLLCGCAYLNRKPLVNDGCGNIFTIFIVQSPRQISVGHFTISGFRPIKLERKAKNEEESEL